MQRVREWVLPAFATHTSDDAGYYSTIDDTGLLPRLGCFLARGFGLMLGTMLD
jgi:hypothetical protein